MGVRGILHWKFPPFSAFDFLFILLFQIKYRQSKDFLPRRSLSASQLEKDRVISPALCVPLSVSGPEVERKLRGDKSPKTNENRKEGLLTHL